MIDLRSPAVLGIGTQLKRDHLQLLPLVLTAKHGINLQELSVN